MAFEDPETPMIRDAMVDGIFYPADRPELSATIQALLSHSGALPGLARLIVSPHGSFEFSGGVMADAFKTAAAGHPARIVVVGSCFHQDQALAYLPESSLFRTPLGDSRVDGEAVSALLETSTNIIRNDLPHLQEHTIEVQLPFIQYLFPEAPIVPVLIGSPAPSVFSALTNALAMVLPRLAGSSLVVVSSNLSAVLDRKLAHREADLALNMVLTGQSDAMLDLAQRHELSAENAAALAVAAFFAQDNDTQIIARSSSLPIHYDPTNVVEYAALAMF